MTLHVHIGYNPGDELALLRRDLLPEVVLTAGDSLPAPAQYAVLVQGRPPREALAASPNLRALVIPYAGLPPTTRELMRDFPHISVHNLHHNAVPTAESLIALLLAAGKFLLPADRAFREFDWAARYWQPNPAVVFNGKTALVLGYGAIGQHAAAVCRALGMTVIGIKRRVEAGANYPDAVYPAAALRDLLPRADALLIALPGTPHTDGLIGAAELALLPPRAVLVNVGRAAVIDEAALYHALESGRLHAAGLDVWYRYPPDEDSRARTPPSAYPFHKLDNVVLSPHRGGSGGSPDVEPLRMAALARLLNAAARGHPLPNRVDLDAGY